MLRRMCGVRVKTLVSNVPLSRRNELFDFPRFTGRHSPVRGYAAMTVLKDKLAAGT